MIGPIASGGAIAIDRFTMNSSFSALCRTTARMSDKANPNSIGIRSDWARRPVVDRRSMADAFLSDTAEVSDPNCKEGWCRIGTR